MIVSQILHVDIVTMYINISEYGLKNDLFFYYYCGYIYTLSKDITILLFIAK